jgi:hypothetical protein
VDAEHLVGVVLLDVFVAVVPVLPSRLRVPIILADLIGAARTSSVAGRSSGWGICRSPARWR